MLSPFVPTPLPTMGQLPGPSLDIWNWGRQRAARRDNNLLSIFRCRPGLDRAGGRSPGEVVPGPPRAADNVGSDGEEEGGKRVPRSINLCKSPEEGGVPENSVRLHGEWKGRWGKMGLESQVGTKLSDLPGTESFVINTTLRSY